MKHQSIPLSLLGVLLGLSLSCGEALVDDAYRGAPLLSVRGQISQVRGALALENDLRVAVFWSPTGSTAIDDTLVEQADVSVELQFPALFEINLFAPPSGIAWRDSSPVHVGLVLIYDDANRDGRFELSELQGGARNLALLFAERDATADESPTGRSLTQGLSLARMPLRCEPVETETPDAPTGWATRVGLPCGAPTDCGVEADWRCVTEDDDIYWSGGYCARDMVAGLPEADGVEPGSIWVNDVLIALWMRECNADADCRADYVCQAEICRPDQPYTLVIVRDFATTPLCPDDDEGDD
ncbi:MAG: hypothetical protein ACI9U2_001229 [Bradymonadia bacterium]